MTQCAVSTVSNKLAVIDRLMVSVRVCLDSD